MRIFKRLFEPSPKMVAEPDLMGEFLIGLLKEDPSLPRPDYVYGAEVEWITEDEARRRETASRNMPCLEELLQDPDVAAIVKASEGLKPVPESYKE